MKILSIFAIISALSASFCKSYAKSYLGIGVSNFSINIPIFIEDNSFNNMPPILKLTNSINFMIGYNIIPYIEVEFEYNHNFQEKYSFDSLNNKLVNCQKSNEYFIYSSNIFITNIVGKYKLTRNNYLFLIAGSGYAIYTRESNVAIGGSNKYITESTISSGLTFQSGFGYEFKFYKNHSISVAYMFNIMPSVSVRNTTINIPNSIKNELMQNYLSQEQLNILIRQSEKVYEKEFKELFDNKPYYTNFIKIIYKVYF